MKLPKYALTIAGTVAATLAVVVLVVNLGLGDKQIDRRLQHLYAVADPPWATGITGACWAMSSAACL